MNEQHKINEAQHFLERLIASRDTPTHFSYDLSAFLSAARSALQYALEEAKTKPGGQVWYGSSLSASSVAKFFKDKRDLSIHVKPVVPNRNISVQETIKVTFHESLTVKIYRADGGLDQEITTESTPLLPPTSPPSSITTSYFFADWPGPEDVETLCCTYLQGVQTIIKDGRAKSFLTP